MLEGKNKPKDGSFIKKGNLGLELGNFGQAQVALRKSQGEHLFNLGLLAVSRHGKFADQQIAGTLQHLLLPKRKRFGLVKSDQTFEHPCNFNQRAGAHAVGILLEAVLPVGGAQVVSDREKIEDFLHLAVPHHPPDANAAHIIAGHHDLEAASFDVEQIELLDGGPDRPAADLLDYGDPVVGVDNFVADVEIQVCTAHKYTREGGSSGEKHSHYYE